ncbi:hypothetical protein I7I50_10624 [Histoplasma capsulatum G186AR]|uniref:AMP-activated protein kinase glycogen-binding domain-containing protein n=1 Tax=Ajellomyces capsulatus TaxID=5037 RepID=A0A8H7Z6M9_AJECA|nr:hypothetical protein I7I52_01862 [Histoplasma capsulatum]QSS69353.1 hypothetical protein I7I50_10624 [Histoplasma capsulatum G186AR]
MGNRKAKGKKSFRAAASGTKTPIMATHTFQWPDPTASEVYVTGTFDNWSRSVKLERSANGFRKDVEVPSIGGKILYKFVVDGAWKIDPAALQEDDGHNNTNNVLLRQNIKKLPPTDDTPAQTSTPTPPTKKEAAKTMSGGVTPESTTAALAAGVPKESDKARETEMGAPTISSVAPDSTTANLAKVVPQENSKDSAPGAFPVTPGESEKLSVSPIPATEGIGNPIHLEPGQAVPDPSTYTKNTISSTVRTDKEGYENASATGAATIHPTNGTNGVTAPFIQSSAPISTTAALAGAVPLETTNSHANGSSEPEVAASNVPVTVKKSLDKAHKEPEAAGDPAVVQEKKEVERELLGSVEPAGSASTGAPAVVQDSIEKAHWNPEAAAVPQTVAEKKEVEQELLHDVERVDASGEPAPNTSQGNQIGSVSPKSQPVAPAAAADTAGAPATEQAQPAVTTGPETTTASAAAGNTSSTNAPATGEGEATPTAATDEAKKKKKKNRASALFSKLKEKFK